MHVDINGEWERALRVWPWPEGYLYEKPCGFLPEAGISKFWEALGVYGIWDGFEETLQVEWLKGNMVLAAPGFPVLSELIQMQIDNTTLEAADMAALLREVEIGRANCSHPLGLGNIRRTKDLRDPRSYTIHWNHHLALLMHFVRPREDEI